MTKDHLRELFKGSDALNNASGSSLPIPQCISLSELIISFMLLPQQQLFSEIWINRTLNYKEFLILKVLFPPPPALISMFVFIEGTLSGFIFW